VVTITGTNDTPTITSVAGITDVLGAVTEDATTTTLSDTGTMTFADVDLTDAHTVSVVKASGTLGGTLTLGSVTESATTSDGSVPWTYTVANSNTQYLALNQTASEVFTVTISDGNGGTVTQNVTVTATGTNDAPTINAIVATNLSEQTNTAALTTTIPVTFTDVDLTDVGHSASITNVVASGITTGLALSSSQLLALVTPGAVTKASGSSSGSINMGFSAPATALDYLATGEVLTLTYTVDLNDGDSGITPQTFVVTITGTNDVPTLSAFTAAVDTTNEDTAVEITLADLIAQGNEADVDGSVSAFVIKSVASGTLKIGADAASAQAWNATTNATVDTDKKAYWTPVANANGALNAFTAVAKDNSGAESASAITATVNVAAVNDAPVINSITVPATVVDTPATDTFAPVTGSI